MAVDVQPNASPLDPSKVTLSGVGSARSVRVVSRSDVDGTTGTYVLALLKTNADYALTVTGEGQSAGEYTAVVSLAGDVNGDAVVTTSDIKAVRSSLGAKRGTDSYTTSADVDRSGRITRVDLLLVLGNLKAAVHTQPPAQHVNPLDVFLPDNAITVSGVDPRSLNSTDASVMFALAGSSYSADAAISVATINGEMVPADQVSVSAQQITVTGALVSGLNDLRLATTDAIGRNIYSQVTVWAGQNTLQVNLVDSAGAPFLEPTSVSLRLGDDQSVGVTETSSSGSVSFANVPASTVLASATAEHNVIGLAGDVGSAGQLTVRMLGFNDVSNVDNNDFSQGTNGWDTGDAPAVIVEHVEDVGPALSGLGAAHPSYTTGDSQGQRLADDERLASNGAQEDAIAPQAPLADQDLSLGTGGEGEQSVSRTFATDPDTVAVRVRYRFVTTEVPGGYFGSQFNDYFRVSLRSQQGGGSTSEANSMNGLGLAAFDAGGSTAWRDVTLPLDIDGDNVQVDLAVANVADALLPSQVIVDFVEEVKVRVVPTLTWNNVQGGLDLRYRVEGAALPESRDIQVTFGNGPNYANRLGGTVFTHSVPAQTVEGDYGPIHIDGATLDGDPTGATHLIAASSERDVGALPDSRVDFGANANPAVISAAMLDAVRDGARQAGQAAFRINSTARGPHDQARAMFTNLTNPANTTAQNITNQHNIYAPAGDAVIDSFAVATQGMTPAQIQANRPQIEAGMEAEINQQGCPNVTRHCADPAQISVVDVSAGAFNANNGPLFFTAVSARVTHQIDERDTNGCYHFELTVP